MTTSEAGAARVPGFRETGVGEAKGGGASSVGAALDAAVARLVGAGVESPRLDAELLLADLLGLGRAALVARRPEPLPPPALAPFEARVARRAAREPVAYILGRQEFYGLDLEVTPAVLIPRPETELVVEEAVAFVNERAAAERERSGERGSPPRAGGKSFDGEGGGGGASSVLVDVGTGSGCIAVAVAVHALHTRVVAVDRSPAALEVAHRNVRRYAVAGQVRVVLGDLLEAVRGGIDVVTANLPYVSSAELEALMPDVRLYEPRVALEGGADGLALLRPLVAQAAGRLVPGGLLVLEVALGQAGRVADLLRSTGAFSDVSTRRDLAGVERLVRGRTWTAS